MIHQHNHPSALLRGALLLLVASSAACSSSSTSSPSGSGGSGGTSDGEAGRDGASSSAGGSAGSGAGGSAGTGAGGSAGTAASGSAGAAGASDGKGYCNRIKVPHAQALVLAKITDEEYETPDPPTAAFHCALGPGEVGGGYNADFVVVTLTLDNTYDSAVAEENAGAGMPISGVGDKAVWVQDFTKANPPIVVAISGTLTCKVSAPQTEKSTIVYSNATGVDQIAAPDAEAFALKMAAICSDIFEED